MTTLTKTHTCSKCMRPTRADGPYGGKCAIYVSAAVTVLRSDPRCTRKISCRLAAELLQKGALKPLRTATGRAWAVPSERDPNVIYVCTPKTCVCPAAVWTEGTVLCKHRLAAAVLAA
jgi:hypothetical protein